MLNIDSIQEALLHLGGATSERDYLLKSFENASKRDAFSALRNAKYATVLKPSNMPEVENFFSRYTGVGDVFFRLATLFTAPIAITFICGHRTLRKHVFSL